MMGKGLTDELSCMRTGVVTKGNYLCVLLFASMDDKTLQKAGPYT